jgi:anti-sigma factor RsiW
MNLPVFRKMLFTFTFPQRDIRRDHVSRVKLHSLVKHQLSDLDIIETIDHLFHCQRCFENFRHIRKAYLIGRLPRSLAKAD